MKKVYLYFENHYRDWWSIELDDEQAESLEYDHEVEINGVAYALSDLIDQEIAQYEWGKVYDADYGIGKIQRIGPDEDDADDDEADDDDSGEDDR